MEIESFPEAVLPNGHNKYVISEAMRLFKQKDDTERYLDLTALRNENPTLYRAIQFYLEVISSYSSLQWGD